MCTWEDSYTIATLLQRRYPAVKLEDVSLDMIYQWTISLPEFDDDPQIINEDILTAIICEWFEEVNPV